MIIEVNANKHLPKPSASTSKTHNSSAGVVMKAKASLKLWLVRTACKPYDGDAIGSTRVDA